MSHALASKSHAKLGKARQKFAKKLLAIRPGLCYIVHVKIANVVV